LIGTHKNYDTVDVKEVRQQRILEWRPSVDESDNYVSAGAL
jgi:hypothetical protein